jgi:hypothetical protein
MNVISCGSPILPSVLGESFVSELVKRGELKGKINKSEAQNYVKPNL